MTVEVADRVLSPQEQRIAREELIPSGSRLARSRIGRMLEGFRDKPPRISIERARLWTESFKETESLPIELRVAKAMANVMAKIEIAIGDEELIVGHTGPLGRHGVLYPEYRVGWFGQIKDLSNLKEGMFSITEEEFKVLEEEVAPYWVPRSVYAAYMSLLPRECRDLMYKADGDTPNGVIHDMTGQKSTMNWTPDLSKVVTRGFNDIKQEAEQGLASLDALDAENGFEKMPFLNAVVIVCDAIVDFAHRYAELARSMATKETNEQRKKELLEIAETCEWVPGNPARTFREAVQSLWLAHVGLSFEQEAGGEGLGRIDQYLYPYYERDMREGRISRDEVLDLLEHLWLNLAQYVRITTTSQVSFYQNYAHFEQITIGGQTREGRDATNDLSYLILESRQVFPLTHPDLMARIHSQTPQPFLMKVCECIKVGQGFPKLLNDEEIIPLLVAKGATVEEALDYSGSGCTEVRLPNKDTYSTLGINLNLGAVLELTLNDGVFRSTNQRLGLQVGDVRKLTSFDEVMDAFKLQVEYILKHAFIKQTISDMVRPARMASPLHSCLHDLCMQQCVDIHSGKVKNGIIQGNFHMVGFGTLVDSLAAIKKLVFDDKVITMGELLDAITTDFEGKEVLRQRCLNAPKHGNNDPYVDSIGREIERMLVSYIRSYRDLCGSSHDLSYVPVTAHVPLGAVVGATPDGRRAKEPLSEGISPTHGADTKGPTVTLMSVANTRNGSFKERQSRLLNMKLSPQAVAGGEGTKSLAGLVRTWCDLKLWHIQFNIINSDTLRAAQTNPEKYRNLLVRVAGYSAYFVDLSPALQEEIIHRTEHQFIG